MALFSLGGGGIVGGYKYPLIPMIQRRCWGKPLEHDPQRNWNSEGFQNMSYSFKAFCCFISRQLRNTCHGRSPVEPG